MSKEAKKILSCAKILIESFAKSKDMNIAENDLKLLIALSKNTSIINYKNSHLVSAFINENASENFKNILSNILLSNFTVYLPKIIDTFFAIAKSKNLILVIDAINYQYISDNKKLPFILNEIKNQKNEKYLQINNKLKDFSHQSRLRKLKDLL